MITLCPSLPRDRQPTRQYYFESSSNRQVPQTECLYSTFTTLNVPQAGCSVRSCTTLPYPFDSKNPAGTRTHLRQPVSVGVKNTKCLANPETAGQLALIVFGRLHLLFNSLQGFRSPCSSLRTRRGSRRRKYSAQMKLAFAFVGLPFLPLALSFDATKDVLRRSAMPNNVNIPVGAQASGSCSDTYPTLEEITSAVQG